MRSPSFAKIRRLLTHYSKPFKVTFYFLLGLLNGLFHKLRIVKKDNYCIKPTYISRSKNVQYDDTKNKDEYQDYVYSMIKKFCLEKDLLKILDFGCGSGYKLIKYFNDFETIGVEIDPAYSFLKDQYPNKRWEYGTPKLNFKEKFDIAIAIDVIEHFINPDDLINFFLSLNCSYYAFSTPDRSGFKILSRIGPPENKSHIREWTSEEFSRYLQRKFKILHHYQSSPYDNLFIVTKIS